MAMSFLDELKAKKNKSIAAASTTGTARPTSTLSFLDQIKAKKQQNDTNQVLQVLEEQNNIIIPISPPPNSSMNKTNFLDELKAKKLKLPNMGNLSFLDQIKLKKQELDCDANSQ